MEARETRAVRIAHLHRILTEGKSPMKCQALEEPHETPTHDAALRPNVHTLDHDDDPARPVVVAPWLRELGEIDNIHARPAPREPLPIRPNTTFVGTSGQAPGPLLPDTGPHWHVTPLPRSPR